MMLGCIVCDAHGHHTTHLDIKTQFAEYQIV